MPRAARLETEESPQLLPKEIELADLEVHVAEMAARELLDVVAGQSALLCHLEELLCFRESDAEGLSASDESQRIDGVLSIHAVPVGQPMSGAEDSLPLVVANCRGADPCPLRDYSDG